MTNIPRTKEEAINQLKDLIMRSERSYDIDLIDRAMVLAGSAHEGQKRALGEDYICHPLAVAAILVEMGMDSETIAAAILHDVVEDTGVELSDLSRAFGENIANLVDGVTKITKMSFSTREEQQAENVRKMLLAMSEDIRVMIIKLADRLHNMRTSDGWSEQKRRDKARETMDIYAPLAHRLGIRAAKEELEDLSLRVLDPVAYHEIEEALLLRKNERDAFLEEIQQRIAKHMEQYGIECRVSGRIKSIPGIYRKMYVQGKTLEEIYDIYAGRVIVNSDNDCYNVLGIVHDMFRPLPNRFKDYISTPKPNMYQSLHTTVISKDKIPFEVQIRTWEMHYTAEYGVAAHWKYKIGLQKKDKLDEKLAWMRQFIENQKDVDDAEDIVRNIKTDLSAEEVFVFTPKGDVIALPTGATVIDFAYAIHTAVGNRMVGAKVDGRIVPLDYKVKIGEIVEVLTTSSPGHGPSRDWLQIVRTGEARTKIRNWFKKERREENIEQGHLELMRELSRNFIRLPEAEMEKFLLAQAAKQHFATIEDFEAAIGYGGVLLSHLIPRMRDEYQKMVKTDSAATQPTPVRLSPRHKHNSGGVMVEGMDNCLVKFARCCNPVPGDPIIGFITRGYGVSIHKRDCTNVPETLETAAEPERWVQAHWGTSIDGDFKAGLQIFAVNRQGLLADITTVLAQMKVMIHAINARDSQLDEATVLLTLGVSGIEHLNTVIARLLQIPGVERIERAGI